MRTFISRSGHASYQMPTLVSKSLLVCLLLLCSVILIASYALAGNGASGFNKRSEVRPAAAAPIPQLIVIGHRMTEAQKRQFDEAEAMADKAATTKIAGLQSHQK